MIETLLQAILEQIDQPKKDLEHNLRALLNEAVTKMDLVSQDELDRQRTALNNANLRLNELLKQVEALDRKFNSNNKHQLSASTKKPNIIKITHQNGSS